MTKPKKKPTTKKPEVTRARAQREASRTTTEARVREISGLMQSGRWLSKVATELAERWGVSVKTVQHASAEASRRLRSALNLEEEAAALAGCFDLAIELATNQGDPRALVLATEAKAKALGLDKPQKIAITDAAGDDLPAPLRGLTPEQVLEYVATGKIPRPM